MQQSKCESTGCERGGVKINKYTGKVLCPICWEEYEREFPTIMGIEGSGSNPLKPNLNAKGND